MSQDLFDELSDEFWRSSGVITFSQVAMRKFVDDVPWTVTPENPDPTLFIGAGDPNDPAVQADASWPKSRLEGAADPKGWLQIWLTHAWIALIFARWEKHYRPEFARIHGVPESAVVSDVIGDVRHLRNDVIHHRGIATPGNTGKCKVLTRFSSGDTIILSPEDIRNLRSALAVSVSDE